MLSVPPPPTNLSLLASLCRLSPLLTLRLDNHLKHPLQDLLDFSFWTHNWIRASTFQMRQDHFSWLRGQSQGRSDWAVIELKGSDQAPTPTPPPPTATITSEEKERGEYEGKIKSSRSGVEAIYCSVWAHTGRRLCEMQLMACIMEKNSKTLTSHRSSWPEVRDGFVMVLPGWSMSNQFLFLH